MLNDSEVFSLYDARVLDDSEAALSFKSWHPYAISQAAWDQRKLRNGTRAWTWTIVTLHYRSTCVESERRPFTTKYQPFQTSNQGNFPAVITILVLIGTYIHKFMQPDQTSCFAKNSTQVFGYDSCASTGNLHYLLMPLAFVLLLSEGVFVVHLLTHFASLFQPLPFTAHCAFCQRSLLRSFTPVFTSSPSFSSQWAFRRRMSKNYWRKYSIKAIRKDIAKSATIHRSIRPSPLRACRRRRANSKRCMAFSAWHSPVFTLQR